MLPSFLKNTRKKIDSHFKSINGYKKYAKTYIDGVKAGDTLVVSTKSLDKLLTAGKMNSTSIAQHKELIKSIAAADKKISRMYGKEARSLARKKYTLPANILTKNVQSEIDRYNLTLQIEKDVNKKLIDHANSNLAQLTKQEAKVSQSRSRKQKVSRQILRIINELKHC